MKEKKLTIDDNNNFNGMEVAIIGISCRFPGALTADEFYSNIILGTESITQFSNDELRREGIDEAFLSDPHYIKSKGYLNELEFFDASLFSISEQDAALMDPQLRLLYLLMYEALEVSGYLNKTSCNDIGVFISSSSNIFWINKILKTINNDIDRYSKGLLNLTDFYATKLSHFFNLTGPSVNLQTACSSSLYAVDTAVKNLLTGGCDIAVAGGVSITLPNKSGYFANEGMIYSKDGKCKAFDSNASGTVGGNGAGLVVLKRLDEAINSNDYIYAVIKGISSNNDGSEKISYTAPSIQGQTRVIKKTLSFAEVLPETISYIESHGTGTNLGDPIEIKALNNVFFGNLPESCAIGAIKANIGHLDNAAGIAGLIKTALILKNRVVPPTINIETINEKLEIEKTPFYFPKILKDFKSNEVYRGSVSSFGIGGTNVYAVLEEPPRDINNEIKTLESNNFSKIVSLSSHSSSSLKNYKSSLLKFINNNRKVNWHQLCMNLHFNKRVYSYRHSFSFKDFHDLTLGLQSHHEEYVERIPKIAFLFPGQGSQLDGMYRSLFENDHYFHDLFLKGANKLQELLGYEIREFIENKFLFSEKFNETSILQPILFLFEYSLAMYLINLGVKPNVMVGHSIGEYTAATIANVFTFEDALKIIVKRAQLMSSMLNGSMLSIISKIDDIENMVYPYKSINISGINSNDNFTVSGSIEEIKQLEMKLNQGRIIYRKINVSHAFHNKMMIEAAQEFESFISSFTINKPTIPYYSNVTGKIVDPNNIQKADYWSTHLISPVLMKNALEDIKEDILLEVGPGQSLKTFASNLGVTKTENILSTFIRNEDPTRPLVYQTISRLWEKGIGINWHNFYNDPCIMNIPLPTHSFDKIFYSTALENNSDKVIYDLIFKPKWLEVDLKLTNDYSRKVFLIGYRNKYTEILEDYFKQNKYDISCLYIKENILIQELISQLEIHANKLKKSHLICAFSIGDTIIVDREFGFLNFFILQEILKFIHGSNFIEVASISVLAVDCLNTLENYLPDKPINLFASLLIGLTKIARIEYENTRIRFIDMSSDFSIFTNDLCFLSYILDSEHDILSLKNKKFLQEKFVLNKEINTEADFILKDNGVYLITGGLGGMGRSFASFITDRVKNPTIILSTRTDINEKDEGSKKEVKKFIEELKKKGCYVELIIADIAKIDLLREALSAIRKKIGKIHGVIHCAGLIDNGGPIQKRNQTSYESMYTKVNGIINIDIILGDEIEFLVNASSLGNIFYKYKWGQVAYAAGNEFLDAFSYIKKPYKIMTINWCDWIDTGMSKASIANISNDESLNIRNNLYKLYFDSNNTFSPKELLAKEGIYSYQGNMILDVVLRNHWPRVAISRINLDTDHNLNVLQPHSNSLQLQSYTKDNIVEKLTRLISSRINVITLNQEDDFFKLGIDSLKAIMIINEVNDYFSIKLKIVDIFNNASIAKLSVLVEKSLSRDRVVNNERLSIITNGSETRYPLTFQQQRLLVHNLSSESNKSLFLLVKNYKITGKISIKKLESCISRLINAYDSLRMKIIVDNGDYYQSYSNYPKPFNIKTENINTSEVTAKLTEFNAEKIDLLHDDYFKVKLFEDDTGNKYLAVKMHHIVADGLSLSIFFHKLACLYNEDAKNIFNKQTSFGYTDYTKEQIKLKEDEKEFLLLKNYWSKRLSGVENITDKLTDLCYKDSLPIKIKKVSLFLDDYCNFKQFCTDQYITLQQLMFSAYCILMYKYLSSKDVIIGNTTSGRHSVKYTDSFGMFVDIIPIRVTIDISQKIVDFIQNVRTMMLNDFSHQGIDINLAIIENNYSLFDIIKIVFVYQGFNKGSLDLKDCEIKELEGDFALSDYPMTINIHENESSLDVFYEINKGIYENIDIEELHNIYIAILRNIIHSSSQVVKDLLILPEGVEKNIMLRSIGEAREIPETNLVELIDNACDSYKERVAIFSGTRSVTFQKLKNITDTWAYYINSKLQSDKQKCIGIYLKNILDVALATIAIMKSGHYFIAINSESTKKHIEKLVQEDTLEYLITESQINFDYGDKGKQLQQIYIAELKNLEPIYKHSPRISNDNYAYLIQTSGTTGIPKKVRTKHLPIVNTLLSRQHIYNYSPNNCSLVFMQYYFDGFAPSFFSPLIAGSKVVLPELEELHDARKITDYIIDQSVDNFIIVPSYFTAIFENTGNLLSNISWITFSGEKFDKNILENIKLNNARIYNEYGVSEVATLSTVTQVLDEYVPGSIGTPIWNTSINILDENNELAPTGVKGEITIAGKGVAEGYLNCTDEDRGNFKAIKYGLGPNAYSSKDRGKLNKAGHIIIFGRKDSQVKINGRRIDLKEIESHINNLKEIRSSHVSFDPLSKIINVYVYFDDMQLTVNSIIHRLNAEYNMTGLPLRFFRVEKFNYNQNGKLNVDQLKKDGVPFRGKSIQTHSIKDNDTLKLVQFVSTLLNMDTISLDENIFHLGIDSLSVMKIVNFIKKQFDIDVSVKNIRSLQTLGRISDFIFSTEMRCSSLRPLTLSYETSRYGLSYGQKQIYYLSKSSGEVDPYSLLNIFDIKNIKNPKRLCDCIQEVLNTHLSLKVNFFQEKDGSVYQRSNVNIRYVPNYISDPSRFCNIIEELKKYKFDLSNDPLLKVYVINQENDSDLHLVFLIHHIIIDEESISTLFKQIFNLYFNGNFPGKVNDYISFVNWQESEAYQQKITSQKKYWVERLVGYESIKRLPFEKQTSNPQYSQTFNYSIKEKNYRILSEMAQECITSKYEMFMGFFAIFIATFFKRNDFILGTPVTLRSHSDFEDIVGYFLNTLPIRFSLSNEDLPFTKLLKNFSINIQNDLENRDIPFQVLLKSINYKKIDQSNPLFNWLFVWQKAIMSDNQPVEIRKYEIKQKGQITDLIIYAKDTGSSIDLNFVCEESVKNEELVNSLIKNFDFYIKQTLVSPNILCNEIKFNDEVNCLQQELNGPKTDYKLLLPLATKFIKVAKEFSNKVAIIDDMQRVKYYELDTYTNNIANNLLNYGLKDTDHLAICLDKSIDLVMLMIAAIKVNIPYIICDLKNNSIERTKEILLRDEVKYIVIDKCLESNLDNNFFYMNISDLKKNNNAIIPTPVCEKYSLQNPMQIIYTSGTTGIPKGVILPQRTIANLIDYQSNIIKNNDARVLSFANISFDVFIQEVFTALLIGGTLVIADEKKKLDPDFLFGFIKKHQINIVYFPTGFFTRISELICANKSFINGLKCIFVAGEKMVITKELIDVLKEHNVRLFNQYGPTESHVVTSYEVIPEVITQNYSFPPIGKPINNIELAILNDQQDPIHIGEKGELYIGGLGLALGYLNQSSSLSSFTKIELNGVKKNMYRTGDIVSLDRNGLIYFHERIDNQVKILGYRVELDEVENVSRNILKTDKVVAHFSKETNQLIIFYIHNEPPELNNVIKELEKKLPFYMVPSKLIRVDNFPLTKNGKTDFRKLVSISNNYKSEWVNKNEVKEKILAIFNKIFDSEFDGGNQQYNILLRGGKSLQVLNFMNEINTSFNTNVPYELFFNDDNLNSIIEYVTKKTLLKNNSTLIFNHGRKNKIFLFPPGGIPLGIVYAGLSRLLLDYELYCFSFVNDTNFLECIKNHAPQSEHVIFLGYSAGGVVAACLAEQLVREGYVIDKLILLDSFIFNSEEGIKNAEKYIREIKSHYPTIFNDTTTNKELQSYVKNYFNYYIRLTVSNVTAKNTYLVKSNEDISLNNSWRNLVKGNYYEFNGKGSHNEMLIDDNLNYNSNIINAILKDNFTNLASLSLDIK